MIILVVFDFCDSYALAVGCYFWMRGWGFAWAIGLALYYIL